MRLEPRRPLGVRLRRWIGEEIAGEEEAAFAAETSERDLRRLRALAPLMLALHFAHILIYRVSDADRASVAEEVVRWQEHVAQVHVATLPVAVMVAAVVSLWPHSWLGRRMGPLVAAAYLAHGALATGVDQIAFANMAAFTGYCCGVAVVFGFRLRTAVWVYGVGATTMVWALFEFQTDSAILKSNLLNAATVVTMSLALSALLASARRRDFRQRRIIASQRDDLASLNANLERRVNEQVAEIVRRAEEVNQLNTQLRARIRERSHELSVALARLAGKHVGDGILEIGTVLGDRFEIGPTIGSGGMGVVHSGRDRSTGGRVAIKLVRPGAAVDLDSMRRFLGEASAAASIEHPAVVRMIHIDVTTDGLLYQVQEFIDGRSLDECVGEGPWPAPAVARLGAVLLDALAAAHAHGVIHRDVKPANIMLVGEAPGLKLLDFGLAKLLDSVAGGSPTQTGSHLVAGTPAYMAPEQVLRREISDRTDIYAAGVVLFELLAGRPLFEIAGSNALMMQHAAAPPPDLATLVPVADAGLARLIGSCLAKSPHDRPPAAELARSLRRFADAAEAPALEELESSPVVEEVDGERDRIARRFRGLRGSTGGAPA